MNIHIISSKYLNVTEEKISKTTKLESFINMC